MNFPDYLMFLISERVNMSLYLYYITIILYCNLWIFKCMEFWRFSARMYYISVEKRFVWSDFRSYYFLVVSKLRNFG